MKREDIIKLYIDTLHSDNTKIAYKRIINRMFELIDKDIQDIMRIDLIKWFNSLSNLSSATQAQQVTCIKSFFRFLHENELIDSNPSVTLKAPKIHNKPKDSITKEEALRLLQWGTYRDKAVVALYLSTGLRVQEIIDLKLSDYIKHRDELIVKTKGGKFRRVIINEACQGYIDNYLKVRKGDIDNLFVTTQGNPLNKNSFNKTLQRMAEKVGIDKHITNHTLRSTFITDLTENHGIYVAQTAVGHKSISTTRRYVRGLENKVNDIMKEITL